MTISSVGQMPLRKRPPEGRAPTLSVVVPVYDEEEVLEQFHQRLAAVMASLGLPWEVVYVNDGSRDRSLPLLTGLHARWREVVVLSLSRNFGKEAAMTAGLDHARGEA